MWKRPDGVELAKTMGQFLAGDFEAGWDVALDTSHRSVTDVWSGAIDLQTQSGVDCNGWIPGAIGLGGIGNSSGDPSGRFLSEGVGALNCDVTAGAEARLYCFQN